MKQQNKKRKKNKIRNVMSSIVTPAATRSEQRYNNTTAQPNPAHVHISASFVYFGATCTTKWTLSGAFISYLPLSKIDIQSSEYKLRTNAKCINILLQCRPTNTKFQLKHSLLSLACCLLQQYTPYRLTFFISHTSKSRIQPTFARRTRG